MEGTHGSTFLVPGSERMNVLPIQRTSIASTIAEMLREDMLSGLLAPGTPLHDADLVSRMAVPLTTIREALAELAHEGLVIHTLHHGVQVTPVSPEDVHDVYAVRRVYERAGLEALLEHRPVDVTWLRAATERMGEAAVAGDWRAAVEADIAFHLALVASAGARRLTSAAQRALMELRIVLAMSDRSTGDLPALVADHQHLVDVIGAGRLRKAAYALQDHLLRGEASCLAAVVASEAA